MYKEISKYYNKIFPLNREKISFIKKFLFPENKKILDIGCATGELAIELNKSGYDVTGIDIDEDMIALAKSYSQQTNENIRFFIGDMLKLSNYFKINEFDLIICWGNTIPHLNNLSEIKKFIHECNKVLNKSGQLSLQVINYRKIISSENYSLPDINNEHIKFKRFYSFDSAGKLIFNTEITIKDSGVTFKNFTPHYPILKEDLLNILKNENFNSLELFSDFKGTAFNDFDISLIINCTKK